MTGLDVGCDCGSFRVRIISGTESTYLCEACGAVFDADDEDEPQFEKIRRRRPRIDIDVGQTD